MKSLLKFFSITALLVVLTAGAGIAQTLYFCEGVDDDGYPEGQSTSFTVGRNGGYLYMLVRSKYACETEHVYFDVYKVDSRGKESFDNTLEMDTETNWVWFWKKITFYDNGTYNIYVYDEYDYELCSGQVRISYR